LELLTKQLEQIEKAMEQTLANTGMKEAVLSIPGIGIVTAASFGKIGVPLKLIIPVKSANGRLQLY